MRFLSLDLGDRRIGVAVSDPLEMIATPLTTIERTTEPEDIDAILRLMTGSDAEAIVVGMPLSLSGRVGQQAGVTRGFVRRLAEKTAAPVETVDERFTSREARRVIRNAGGRPSQDRPRVDAVAAAIILQTYLDSRRARRIE